MSQPVRARRLSQDEGRYLLRLVRRGRHESIRVRRALIVMASASGTTVPAIARLVAADEDTVRDVIHAFCAMRRSVISLAQRGEIGGISLDLMANPAPKGNIGDRSMPEN